MIYATEKLWISRKQNLLVSNTHQQDVLHHPNYAWWRHQMETFPVLLAICTGNSPVIGEFPSQRTVTWSYDVFFDLRLNKRLSKQSGGWWFETPSRPLWRHHNGIMSTVYPMKYVKSISHKISHKITFLFCLVSRSLCNQLLVDTRGTFTQAL